MKIRKSMFMLMLVFAINSCKTEGRHACFDKKLYRKHNGICQDDCPGVVGCDGKTYCNECYAGREGISVP